MQLQRRDKQPDDVARAALASSIIHEYLEQAPTGGHCHRMVGRLEKLAEQYVY